MSGQHVGAQSDSLVADPDVEAIRAQLIAKKAALKPTGKVFKGVSNVGDGDMCPVPGHGRKYVMDGGRQWCPNQSHDDEHTTRGRRKPLDSGEILSLDISAMEV